MQTDELATILNRMIRNRKEKAIGKGRSVHILFGIRYAKEIQLCGESLAPTVNEIAVRANNHKPTHNGTEIGKGVKLADYVTINGKGSDLINEAVEALRDDL